MSIAFFLDVFTTAKTLINLAIVLNTDVYELFKPEGLLPDKAADIIARYTEEIKVTVGKIGNVYEGREVAGRFF